MRNRKTIMGFGLLAAVLFLAVGYAAISNIDFSITGTASAEVDTGLFEVAFDKNEEKTTTSNTGTTATVTASVTGDQSAEFVVSGLKKKNETVTATYTIKNSSDTLDAKLSEPIVTLSGDTTSFYDVTAVYGNGSEETPILEVDDTITLTVTVKMKKTPIDTVNDVKPVTISISFSAEPVQPGSSSSGGSSSGSIPEIDALLYFGERYTCIDEVEGTLTFIFHEDGSLTIENNGFIEQVPAGFVEYEEERILLEGEVATISSDKKTVTFYQMEFKLDEGNEDVENATAATTALTTLIRNDNPVITAKPTLTTSSNNSSDASGLYASTDTNDGSTTYYFRGDVTNNYVKFAGYLWRIVRINEDETIRLIMQYGGNLPFHMAEYEDYTNMYYSNSDTAKPQVDSWYKTYIEDKGYDSYVATGTFCEQAKVKKDEAWTSGNATMEVYTTYMSNFKCSINDGNEKGILNSKVGLISIDEVIHAGGYFQEENDSYYLNNGNWFWTMSPAGFRSSSNYNGDVVDWYIDETGEVRTDNGLYNPGLRPVINLNANVLAAGTGTKTDPYVIKTN